MQQPTPYEPKTEQREIVDNVENIDGIAKTIADEMDASDPPELTIENDSAFSDDPDVIDGTSESFASKTAAEEQAEAKIERPMQDRLNSTEDMEKLKRACADAIADLTQYELDRADVNAEMQAIREKLEALGVGKKPLAMAIAYSKMNTKQRDGFDTAYTILRDVIGEPIQSDLFVDVPDERDPGAVGEGV